MYNNILTVIITASFIKSHPSIHYIKATLESLSYINLFHDSKIILAHDYYDEPNYYKYINNLRDYIKYNFNIKIIINKSHGHLVGNISNALINVTTKYILLIQHDLPFIESFDIQKVIEDLDNNPNIKHVRFNHRNNIKIKYDCGFAPLRGAIVDQSESASTEFNAIDDNIFGYQQQEKNYTYTRTPGWSDRNHLCLTSYYNNIILKECKKNIFMEKFFQGKIKNIKIHDKYGTYLFGPLNYKPMIKHLDGRRNN